MASKSFGSGLINLRIDNPLREKLARFPKEVAQAIDKVVVETGDTLFERIKTDTPRDRGQAGGAVSRWTKTKAPAAQEGQSAVVLSNDAPHINVLEHGGYPVIPNSRPRTNAAGPGLPRGAATLGGYPPGPRTQVAPGGSPIMVSNVSRQAPRGMVRQNLERIQGKFVFDLEEAIDEAYENL